MSHPPLQDDHSIVQLENEDYEFHTGPDQAARDRGIAPFLDSLEVQEQHSYTGLGDVLSCLPPPTTVDQQWLSVHNAMEAGMLQHMDDKESRPPLHGHGVAGARYAPFSEEEGHCGSVERLARSVPSQIASCMHETRGALYQ
jgi:hypothetical protein